MVFSNVNVTKNVVDKYVQAMILPLNLMQTIALCPKYIIKDNVISPNNFIIRFYCFCGTLFFLSAYLYRVCFLYDVYISKSIFILLFGIFDFIFYFNGFATNFIINIFQSNNHVHFVLNFQDIYKCFCSEISLRSFIFGNWISVATILFFYAVVITMLSYDPSVPSCIIVSTVCLLIFDAHMIYAIRLIKLLRINVGLWIHLLHSEVSTNAVYCKRMKKVYVKIIECYNIIKSSFQSIVRLFFDDAF